MDYWPLSRENSLLTKDKMGFDLLSLNILNLDHIKINSFETVSR